ncbi:MAG: ferric uptake regulator, Fur family [Ilumatobacteraceae bacterium]|nr:ferric uptake regulator, Fur family [Ilumatobacteraceae bacterium]
MTTPALHRGDAVHTLEAALDRIRERGGRVTPAKRELATLLYGSAEPLSADQIFASLGVHDRSIVYRALTQFEELGIAEHVHLGHGQAVYRRRGLATLPVACMVCGTTVELPAAELRAFSDLIADRTGIRLDLVHFPLMGRCLGCSTPD